MLVIDVEIPDLGQVYEFELNEEKKTGRLIKEMIGIIALKEGKQVSGEEQMLLYAYRSESILQKELTLKEQGIRNGEKLVLF